MCTGVAIYRNSCESCCLQAVVSLSLHSVHAQYDCDFDPHAGDILHSKIFATLHLHYVTSLYVQTSYLAALERNLMMVLVVKNPGQLGGEFNKWLHFIRDKNFLEIGHLYEAAEALEKASYKVMCNTYSMTKCC
eukprot:18744-Heterococcus_DN1.PRE.4